MSDVKDALKCLVILYGEPMKMPARYFWKGIHADEEAERDYLAQEGHQQIERYFRRFAGALEF